MKGTTILNNHRLNTKDDTYISIYKYIDIFICIYMEMNVYNVYRYKCRYSCKATTEYARLVNHIKIFILRGPLGPP